jgi:hypothetical protein
MRSVANRVIEIPRRGKKIARERNGAEVRKVGEVGCGTIIA